MDMSNFLIFISIFITSNAIGIISSVSHEEDNRIQLNLPEDNDPMSNRPYSDRNGDEIQILKRLETNEQLVQQLLSRVEYLESREKSQQRDIRNLHTKLDRQETQTASLQRVLSRIFNKRPPSKSWTGKNQTSIKPEEEFRFEAKQALRNKSQRIRRTENDTPVAFFATLSTSIQHAGVHQIYVFDHVVTNLGNAYNSHNGNFIAPVSGTYVFSVTLFSEYLHNVHAQFFRNGQRVTWLYLSGAEAGFDTASQTIVLQLQKGDDVSIHNIDLDATLYGSHYSSFAGFLLYQDYSSSAIVGK